MQIDTKIYYDATGQIIWDKGEMSGSVAEGTYEEDVVVNPAVYGCDFITIPYGQRPAEIDNMGSWKVDINTKLLIIYPRLTISTDKAQIIANGTDTATITVSGVGTDTVNFSVNGVDQTPAITPTNDIATFQFATNVLGAFVISAKTALYGQNSVTIQGV